MIGRSPGDSKAETTGPSRKQNVMMSEFSSTEQVNVSVTGYAGRPLPRPWRCAMQCPRCHERFENGGHWCFPYANWVAQGMLDFVRSTIGARDAYRQTGKGPEAVAGFSSCLVMSVTMIAEISLKTLLAQEGRTPSEFRRWGHDLHNLHDALSEATRARIREKYDSLGPPYSEWKGPDDLEAIIGKERRNFVAWRYLAEGHDASLTSNPYWLAAVAYALFSLHVEKTDLPEIGAP